MLKLGMKNVRRLQQVDPIELRRITLLVGRNSSGKSTFLRTFPLMRQSIVTNTSAPVLWFGDLVDYGNYEGVVSDNESERSISFTFELDEINANISEWGYYSPAASRSEQRTFNQVRVELDLSAPGGRRIERIRISSAQPSMNFDIFVDGDSTVRAIHFNGRNVFRYYTGTVLHAAFDEALPTVYAFPDDDSRDLIVGPYGRSYAAIIESLAETLTAFAGRKTVDDEIRKFAAAMLLSDFTSEGFLELAKIPQTGRLRGIATQLAAGRQKKLLGELVDICATGWLLPLLNQTCRELRRILSDVLYIGPARASSQRYYRIQDLAVSEIDPDGKNFPMFLKSLHDFQLDEFSEWVENLFGYRVSVTEIPGHISIEIDDGARTTNVADTGYGVSQVLPVLGQIWWAAHKASRYSSNPTSIVAIEQPELHLHPAHQALLADALAEPPKMQGEGLPCFVVETHSETLVNRLGQLIGEGRLNPDDVQIIIFEAYDHEEARATHVSISRFDEDGQLVDWPYGFFQPVL